MAKKKSPKSKRAGTLSGPAFKARMAAGKAKAAKKRGGASAKRRGTGPIRSAPYAAPAATTTTVVVAPSRRSKRKSAKKPASVRAASVRKARKPVSRRAPMSAKPASRKAARKTQVMTVPRGLRGKGPIKSRRVVFAQGKKRSAGVLLTRNPMISAGQMVVSGATLALGLVVAEGVSRFVATMGPKGGYAWVNTEAAIRQLHKPTMKQYGAVGGLAVIAGLGAFMARKTRYPSVILGSLAVAHVAWIFARLVQYEILPMIFKTDGSERNLANRLLPLEQKAQQEAFQRAVEQENKEGVKSNSQATKELPANYKNALPIPLEFAPAPAQPPVTAGFPQARAFGQGAFSPAFAPAARPGFVGRTAQATQTAKVGDCGCKDKDKAAKAKMAGHDCGCGGSLAGTPQITELPVQGTFEAVEARVVTPREPMTMPSRSSARGLRAVGLAQHKSTPPNPNPQHPYTFFASLSHN